MTKLLHIAIAPLLAGCSGGFFENKMGGQPFCDPTLNGDWVLPAEQRELYADDLEDVELTVRIDQPSDCSDSTFLVEISDPDETGTLSWELGFVRAGGRIFANLRLTQIEGEPVELENSYDIVEVRIESGNSIEASLTDAGRLIELIDAGRLDGTYSLEIHGPIIDVENESDALAAAVTGDSRLFVEWVGLERSTER